MYNENLCFHFLQLKIFCGVNPPPSSFCLLLLPFYISEKTYSITIAKIIDKSEETT